VTIKKIQLNNLYGKPKPRGQIGKYGNMTHSMNGYREWQNQVIKQLNGSDWYIPENFHSLVFNFHIKPKSGHPPDLSNMQGGMEDVLVKNKNLVDDNWKILKRYYTFGQESDRNRIIIYACETKADLLFCIEKFSD
jgi:Holliday junction resolvase RusA-like endonuclease